MAKTDTRYEKHGTFNAWIYLLVVFVGMGVIDVLFKQIAVFKTLSINTSLFIVFMLAFACFLNRLDLPGFHKKMRFSWPHILIGWVLGDS